MSCKSERAPPSAHRAGAVFAAVSGCQCRLRNPASLCCFAFCVWPRRVFTARVFTVSRTLCPRRTRRVALARSQHARDQRMSGAVVLPSSMSGETLSTSYHTEDVQLLGRGKFSVVHCTRRRSDGLSVALKTIQIFEMGTKERNECMNEIQLLQKMQHPHIIQYLDCVIEQNELTVVMELVRRAVWCRCWWTRAVSEERLTADRHLPTAGGARRSRRSHQGGREGWRPAR